MFIKRNKFNNCQTKQLRFNSNENFEREEYPNKTR